MTMRRHGSAIMLVLVLAAGAAGAERSFDDAAIEAERRLDESVRELEALRATIAEERLPMSRKLADLERDLLDVRLEYQEVTRRRDGGLLDLTTLRTKVEARREEFSFLGNLLADYQRKFASRLHVAELQRWERELETAQLAPERGDLGPEEVVAIQAEILATALDRLDDALGGATFPGTAVDATGLVKSGTFLLIGPAALFRSDDGEAVGTAEQRIGSLEPTLHAFADPLDAAAARSAIVSGAGVVPLDATLGNAHRIAATEETLLEHVKKGGPVMVPIFALAGAATLVALLKLVGLLLVKRPSAKRVRLVIDAIRRGDGDAAEREARAIGGPVGRMLLVGVEHRDEPRELVEETMYETVLTTRLKLQRFLPFVGVCAASAPLLGLLGTVTGIIGTFKLITIFGSGDVKTLSGGISEALITTEFGLIVAIPSLLMHAILTRMARGIVDQMEKAAIAFTNATDRASRHRRPVPAPRDGAPGGSPDGAVAVATADQVRAILGDILEPVVRDGRAASDRAPMGAGR